MAPKKNKKTKDKGKASNTKRKPSAIEIGKREYEARIAEMNQTLAELRSKQIEYENMNTTLKQQQIDLIEDEKDIIAYLNRTIQLHTDEINSIQNDCNKVEEERVREAQEFENQKQQMKENAAQMEEHLLSDLKLTFGMSHALEEFRLFRDELMAKYELLEQSLEEQKERHKNAIYEVEKMFIIGEDKLKREMDAKLRWLIEEFQAVTDLRVSATTQRVIKENIVLNNMIEVMLAKMKKLYEANDKLEKRDEKLRLLSDMSTYEASIMNKQSYTLQMELFQLIEEYFNMDHTVKRVKSMEPTIISQQETKRKISAKLDSLKQRKSILQQHLHEARCQREDNAAKIRYELNRNEELKEMLRQVEGILQSGEMNDEVYSIYAAYPEDQDSKSHSKSTVLYQIFAFLKQVREWNRYHSKTIEILDDRNDIYMSGRAGLVPRKVVLKSMEPIMIEKAEQTDVSLVEDAKLTEESWSIASEGEVEVEAAEESIATPVEAHDIQIEEEEESTSTSSTIS